jgi:REP element-mobilizing transposase RayT
MSRLRLLDLWLFISFFFLACWLSAKRRVLAAPDFACVAHAIRERRIKHRFLLKALAFPPDHWRAIIYPPYPLTISNIMQAANAGSTLRINAKPEEVVLNRVEGIWVSRPENWPWSSNHIITAG